MSINNNYAVDLAIKMLRYAINSNSLTDDKKYSEIRQALGYFFNEEVLTLAESFAMGEVPATGMLYYWSENIQYKVPILNTENALREVVRNFNPDFTEDNEISIEECTNAFYIEQSVSLPIYRVLIDGVHYGHVNGVPNDLPPHRNLTNKYKTPFAVMVEYFDNNCGGDPWRQYLPESTLKEALDKAIKGGRS